MSEYIGSRISLISKSDIRYVGILHEISSENSTVALENVTSFGTEGRRDNPEDEIPPSDNIYEYIVFRGSDVKNLSIEQPAPKENKPPQPPVPNDPAILGAQRPPHQGPPAPGQRPPQPQLPNYGQPPPYSPYAPYPPFAGRGYGPQGGFPGGPGGYGYPGMPYGAPPGWYPPPGQGFPGRPGPFPPQPQMPIGPPGQQQPPPPPEAQANQEAQPNVPTEMPEPEAAPKPTEAQAPSQPSAPAPIAQPKQAPPPPVESKPDVAAALAPAHPPAQTTTTAPAPIPGTIPSAGAKPTPTGPKSNRVVPAMPLSSAGNKAAAPPKIDAIQQQPASNAPAAPQAQPAPAQSAIPAVKAAQQAAQLQSQTVAQQAAAAVAAAMAKLGPAPGQQKPPGQTDAGMDNLAKKVAEMRTDDRIRHSRQQGTGGYAAGHRGSGGRGRGRGRGDIGGPQGQPRRESHSKVEVPAADFDFESANAKFNKQDLVKEAIATGSPLGTPADEGVRSPAAAHAESATNGTSAAATTNGADGKAAEDVVVPPPAHGYNKAASFFDNISSELKDREEAASQNRRLGGQEFRSEERRKNLETFGQGSVDSYRGGFRGRGRGRGFGRGRGGGYGRGRGGGFRGRGESGGQGAAETETA